MSYSDGDDEWSDGEQECALRVCRAGTCSNHAIDVRRVPDMDDKSGRKRGCLLLSITFFGPRSKTTTQG